MVPLANPLMLGALLAAVASPSPAPFPAHATSDSADMCVKATDVLQCRQAINYYNGTFLAAVKRKDMDEACLDGLFGATVYLHIAILESKQPGVDPDPDLGDAAQLYDQIGGACSVKYTDMVVQIMDYAQKYKEGDIPVPVQALNIIEGHPVQNS